MELAGSELFKTSLDNLWNRLRDVEYLVQSIPGMEDLKNVTDVHAECRLRPGFSFVRGVLQVEIDQLAADEPTTLVYQFRSKGIGSSSTVTAHLALEPKDNEIEVQWKGVIGDLGGLLKAVPKGLIQGAAQSVINDLLEKLKSRIEAETE